MTWILLIWIFCGMFTFGFGVPEEEHFDAPVWVIVFLISLVIWPVFWGLEYAKRTSEKL